MEISHENFLLELSDLFLVLLDHGGDGLRLLKVLLLHESCLLLLRFTILLLQLNNTKYSLLLSLYIQKKEEGRVVP